MDIEAAAALHRSVAPLTEAEWIEMVVASAAGPTVDGITLPGFPDSDDVLRTAFPRRPDEQSLRTAATIYGHIKQLFEQRGRRLDPETKVLDVGCGWGRIYRFYLKDVSPENLYGLDTDPRLIRLCERTLPAGQFALLDPAGPVPFPDGSFDLLYANSVLSHLTRAEHIAAVTEWTRVLAPGGCLVATVFEPAALEMVRRRREQGKGGRPFDAIEDLDEQSRRLDEDGFIWVPTSRRAQKTGYGLAYLTPEWLREHWPRELGDLEVTKFDDWPQSFAVATKDG